jgi:predicted nucleotide-binding protein
MQKEKWYYSVRFTPEVLATVFTRMRTLNRDEGKSPLQFGILSVDHDDAKWDYDSLEEFLADYRKFKGNALVYLTGGPLRLTLNCQPSSAGLKVEASNRDEIESVFAILEAAQDQCRVQQPPPKPLPPPEPPVVFIGHGRSPLWRDLKDHLHEKHGYEVVAYETGARAGHTIRDVLEDMVAKSSFALLVMTAEDEQADGNFRARQNVVHEAGLFQGRLGFARAILLLEERVEEFTNVQGVQYLRFSSGNIKEVFGDVLATLRREFGN